MEIKPPKATAKDMRWNLAFVARTVANNVCQVCVLQDKGKAKNRIHNEKMHCLSRLSVARLAGAIDFDAYDFLRRILDGETDAETVRAFRMKYEQPA